MIFSYLDTQNKYAANKLPICLEQINNLYQKVCTAKVIKTGSCRLLFLKSASKQT